MVSFFLAGYDLQTKRLTAGTALLLFRVGTLETRKCLDVRQNPI